MVMEWHGIGEHCSPVTALVHFSAAAPTCVLVGGNGTNFSTRIQSKFNITRIVRRG